MVDADNRLHRVIVADAVAREARRCLDAWHGLQARAARPKQVVIEEKAAPAPVPAPAPPEAEKAAPASDAAYIETPRCTTCEECVKINSRMFVYDANKQAYIADPRAGTYRELVEAAESCQVSIIHPGKPLDANEPGLAELAERAKPFL
jgi:ferredoxin